MDVRLPDGTIIRNVPDGITQTELMAKVNRTQTLPSQSAQVSQVPINPRVEERRQEGGLRTAFEQGMQGATLGFADEAANLIGAGIASAVTGEPFSELVEEAQQRGALRRERQMEQRPITSIGSQLVGGLGTGVAGAATKAGTNILSSIGRSGLAGKVGKSAALGGATGAISGTGSAEGDFKDRIEGAKTGALVGATVGGALPVVGSVARKAVETARGTKKVVTGRTADAIVKDVINNQSPKDMLKTIEGTDSILSLVDVAGDEAEGLLRSVAKKTGGTKNYVADFLENRSLSSGARINKILSQKVSNVDNYFQNLDDLAKGRAVASAPLYKKAEVKGANLKQTQRLSTLLADKRIVDAIDEGKKTFGVSAEAKRNSVAAIDGAKKALDDDIGALERAGRSGAAGRLRDLKNQLVGEVDRQVPEYKKARAVFSGFKSIEDAQEKGLNFLKQDPELIKREIKRMSPSEHDAYVIGVRRALKNQIDRTADAGDPAKKIFGNELVRDKIQAAFPNKKGFEEFARRMEDEIRAANTKFQVLGGSRSDFNLNQDGALLLDTMQASADRGAVGAIDKLSDAMFTAVRNRALGITDENAREVANILLDKEKGVEFLEKLVKEQDAVQSKIIQGFIPDFQSIRNQQAANVALASQAASAITTPQTPQTELQRRIAEEINKRQGVQ